MTNSIRIAARSRSTLALVQASVLAILLAHGTYAQTLTGTVVVRVTAESAPIEGAPIATGSVAVVTDRSGSATFSLPTGNHSFRVTPEGFRPESLAVFVGVGTRTITVPM